MCTLVTNNLYVIVLAWSMSRTPFYVIQTLTVIFQRSHGIYTTSKDKNIDKEIITLQHIHFENLYSSCERQSPQFIARSPGSPETMMWQPDFLGSLQKCNPIPPPNIPASTLTHMCFCLESGNVLRVYSRVYST